MLKKRKRGLKGLCPFMKWGGAKGVLISRGVLVVWFDDEKEK